MNPLTILPAKARKYAYAGYATVGLGLGSVPVYCSATADTTPVWVLGALAVYAFVGAPLFGATAVSNTPQD
ncbi:MAG: hypothetical protein ACRDPS_08765 [Nocardioides sp.]|uniref:hypothetical protein n=1 Tax=Nocardioides sp. TaxID=35761 RepID=UPI003D6A6D46